MSQLLYHSIERTSSDTSPFDDVILQVAEDSDVSIVSPFIGVAYLERIIALADNWRLISDVEAWLASLSTRARPRAWEFIRENLPHIHHCAQIHAKSVIGQHLAMFGSANLTSHGILGRTELGILIDAPVQILELQTWFDGLWGQTRSPIIDETSAFVTWLDEESYRTPVRRQTFTLSEETRKVRARLINTTPAIPRIMSPALDLSVVAHDLITKDQRRYDSLDAAIQAAIDALANSGFGLGDLVTRVRQGYPVATTREIYFLLLQYCANHPRSVFVESTVNRLVIHGCRFVQSEKDRLNLALEPYRQYLLTLVQHLASDESRDLPRENILEASTGIPERDQVILVGELTDCGFIELEDLPGELPKYRLAEVFDWTERFHFFGRVHTAWKTLKATPPKHLAPVFEDDLEELDDRYRSSVLEEEYDSDNSVMSDKALSAHMQAALVAGQAQRVRDIKQRLHKQDSEMHRVLLWLDKHERRISGIKALILELQAAATVSPGIAKQLVLGTGGLPKLLALRQIPNSREQLVYLEADLTESDFASYPQALLAYRTRRR